MFCLGHPRLIRPYVHAALAASTLPILVRPGSAGWQKFQFHDQPELFDYVSGLEKDGLPMVDDVHMMNLDTHENRLEEAKGAFEGLAPGFTHFILHPAVDTPELRAMAPDWRCRVADYQTFQREALRKYVQQIGVQVIGYGALRDALRTSG